MNIIKCASQAGGIGIWKCWFLWREENRRTRRKTLGARTRTNNKLNPHMTPGPGIEPGPHWWRESALTTAPSLLPIAQGVNKQNRQWSFHRRPFILVLCRLYSENFIAVSLLSFNLDHVFLCIQVEQYHKSTSTLHNDRLNEGLYIGVVI